MKDVNSSSVFSTRMSATMGALCGYERYQGVGFTRDEIRALEKFYGFDLGGCESELERAGSLRNLFRHAEKDGMRIMAMLGRHLEEDEDPVRLVSEGLASLGLDVAIEDAE